MPPEWNSDLQAWLREQALAEGFDSAGVASVPPAESKESHLDYQRFSEWIGAGRAGEMEYLKRRNDAGTLLRSGVEVAIPWARSVIVCALNYNAAAPLSIAPAQHGAGWIARYAWSGRRREGGDPSEMVPTDYHEELLGRLRRVEQALKMQVDCESKCYVDTGPIVERSATVRAGVGWIGKNTCVIDQKLGSWLLLGIIVTSLPVPEDAVPEIAADRCGSCTRCIDACPTDALIAPRQMDASRCIAYLTIEKKGAIPKELREPMGR